MQENSYSMVAAKWWVEKILEVLPAEAFWGEFSVEKALNINKFIDSISDEKKEIYINSLAKKIESHIKKHFRLIITYPQGIVYPGNLIGGHKFRMEVDEEKVKVSYGDNKSEIIYQKQKQ